VILYSSYIDKIETWLESFGVRVNRHADQLPFYGGLYRSESKQIFLNISGARDALLVLAHEAGHWMGYQIEEKPHSYQRERQAYVYGWKVLQLFRAPITRTEWVEDCRSSAALRGPAAAVTPRTTHLYLDNP
jgi:hypothetical protein